MNRETPTPTFAGWRERDISPRPSGDGAKRWPHRAAQGLASANVSIAIFVVMRHFLISL